MQSILLALALSAAPAAAFAPSAQPRASVVRFMDEDALKNKILNQGPAEFNKIGGVEVATEMPDDIKFEVPIPAKVMGRWDGECAITVSEGEMKAGSGNSATVNVVPDSMGYGRVPSLETPSHRRQRESSARLTVRFTQRTTTPASRTRPSGSRSSRPSASWTEGAAPRRR